MNDAISLSSTFVFSSNDIIHRAIPTSCKNRFMESTLEWEKIVLDAIETRRLRMIERGYYIKQYRLAPQQKSDDNLQQSIGFSG
ncbi:unnamed protein product [Adineta ricciae]|uniref:Uncharacterized protein n=1 Tax=Adineta ricciae TaxID=249248 RepID=A0A815MWZ2_ADIRI|nr:unnamed protein product [Adineta ricciae]